MLELYIREEKDPRFVYYFCLHAKVIVFLLSTSWSSHIARHSAERFTMAIVFIHFTIMQQLETDSFILFKILSEAGPPPLYLTKNVIGP